MKNPKSFFYLVFSVIIAVAGLKVQGQTNNQPAEINVDTNLLRDYVGRYAYDDGTISLITLEGGQMYVQYTGQPRLPIFSSSENEFFLKVVEARLKFLKDENGKVTKLIHYQNGMQFEPRRLPDEIVINLDPVIFDKYVGKYLGENNQVIEVYKEGDKLWGKTEGLPICQLHPVSETEFFPKEVNARVWFVVSDDGTVNSANLDFNGYKSTIPRIKD
jgi:hypothetical protein